MSDTAPTTARAVSILETLAVGPDGTKGDTLTLDELSSYLQRTLNTDGERERLKRHALRDEMYRDGGVRHMHGVIDKVFQDERVRELRKHWVEHARYNNPLKRIVNELSTVYSEPAKRTLAGNEANQKRYDDLLDQLDFEEWMFQASRLLTLHRALLIGFRVRQLPDGTRDPCLDVATPADARVLLHPSDNKHPLAWIIRSEHRPARNADATMVPMWTLWSAFERVSLRDDLSVIPGTYKEHGLGVNPWVLFTLSPVMAHIWPGEEGEDLVAARTASWITNVFVLKESKSATKQTIIQGDGTNTARGQAADSEVPAELADGQSMSTVDMSMDLSMFRDTDDHIIEHAGLDYGMAPSVTTHAGVQSAEARELLRLPLRELRKHQQKPLRKAERAFAIVMAAILKVDLPAMAFDPAGWRIEFGEAQTPMSKIDELNLFTAARAEGLDNSVDFLIRQRPGMTADEAMAEILYNILVETLRNRWMRPLAAISGSMGAQTPNPNDPNGGAAPAAALAPGQPPTAIEKPGADPTPSSPAYVPPKALPAPIPKTRGQ